MFAVRLVQEEMIKTGFSHEVSASRSAKKPVTPPVQFGGKSTTPTNHKMFSGETMVTVPGISITAKHWNRSRKILHLRGCHLM